MSFTFKRVDTPADDLTWLGSKHAVGDARTVTLSGSAFSAYADDGLIPSGIALVESADGKFVPATSPTEVDGFLLAQKAFDGADVVAPLLDHGRVIASRLPDQAVDGAEIQSTNFIVVGGARVEVGGGAAEGNG